MAKRDEVLKQIPTLRNPHLIDASVRQHVEAVRTRLENATDFDTKRRFLLDHIARVVYANDRIALHGAVPVNVPARDAPEQPSERSKIGFSIEGTLNRKPQVSSRSHRAPQGAE